MSKKKPNEAQHTVPKCYQQNFTDSDGRIWLLNPKPTLRVYSNAPRNTLTRKDYYSLSFLGADNALIIEKGFLGGLESQFAEIYHTKIKKHIRLDDEEKAAIATFLAAQLSRVPYQRDALVDFINRIEEHVKPFMELSDEQKRKMTQYSSPLLQDSGESMPVSKLLEIRDDIDTNHTMMLPGLTIDIAPVIYKMKWSFMIYDKDDDAFITSDNPCAMINPVLEKKLGIGRIMSSPGLGQKDVEFIFPISSSICLLCGWQIELDRTYIPVNREMVDEANKRQLRHSSLLITSNEEQALGIKRHIEKRGKMHKAKNVLSRPLDEIITPLAESYNLTPPSHLLRNALYPNTMND